MKLTASKKNEAKLDLLKLILKLTKSSKFSEKEKKIIPWSMGNELFATIKTHIDDTYY